MSGGGSEVDNGALVGQTRHQYLHSLERDEEEIANNLMRQWKMNFLEMKGNGEIVQTGTYTPDFSDCIVIPCYPNDRISEKKYRECKNPSRARKKKELQQLLEEYEEEFEI